MKDGKMRLREKLHLVVLVAALGLIGCEEVQETPATAMTVADAIDYYLNWDNYCRISSSYFGSRKILKNIY